MAKPKESDVRLVIQTSLTGAQVNQFIDDAWLWVSETIASAGLSEDRLELITRYLACAMIRIRDLGLKSATFDEGALSEVYQVDLYVSEYLTRAAAFDPTGKVRQMFLSPSSTRVGGWRVGTGFTAEAQTAQEE